MEMKPPNRLSVRVRRNKDNAVTRIVLSFNLKNNQTIKNQTERKHIYIQSNIFDEKILNFEFCDRRYSVMIGPDENLKDAVYVIPHHP